MNLVNFTSIDSFFKPKYRKDIYMHELFLIFQKTEVVQFEMDESRLAHVLQNMKDIEDQIVQYCQQ